jgi:integrase
MRADTLFDFCYGLSPRWREKSELQRTKLAKEDKIHPGYGSMAAADLRRHHLESWLDAHKGWTDRRTPLQAVRRALNHAVDDGLIPSHGIEKFRVPQGRARVTYLSPEQERALIAAARPAFKLVLRVLIRTGMRPGELAKLTQSHVIDSGTRIELRFEGEESKNGKVRSVKITDPALIDLIRSQANMNGPGPIFRSESGKPWKVHYMSQSFRRVKKRVAKAGMKFDADTCIYSCRHTFAKRSLLGYWTGKPINMDMLAALMGNTPEVCRKHYADILKALDGVEELLWAAC